MAAKNSSISKKHFYRRLGVRPCNIHCPYHSTCDVKPKRGYPCPIELHEVTDFSTRLVRALALEGNPLAWGLAELAAVQRIRIRRMNAFLAGREDKNWAQNLRRFVEILLKAEKEYRETLKQLRMMAGNEIQIDLDELMLIDVEAEGAEAEDS